MLENSSMIELVNYLSNLNLDFWDILGVFFIGGVALSYAILGLWVILIPIAEGIQMFVYDPREEERKRNEPHPLEE